MVGNSEPIETLLRQRFPDPPSLSRDGATRQLREMIGRASVRAFTPEKVDPDLMTVLLAAALSAPSKSDFQQASVIVVESAELRAELTRIIAGNPWLAGAPHLMIFCADTHRLRTIASTGGTLQGNNDLEAFFNATVDAALAMQAFITAAESVGLGCCPLSAVRSHLDALAPLFALPAGVLPVAGLAFGFPAEDGRISMRLPQRLTVHVDRYSVAPIDREIEAYDARRQVAVVNRKGLPAKWSASKTAQLNESDRTSFPAFVKASGFEF